MQSTLDALSWAVKPRKIDRTRTVRRRGYGAEVDAEVLQIEGPQEVRRGPVAGRRVGTQDFAMSACRYRLRR